MRNAEPYERDKLQWEYIEDKYVDVLQMGQADWKQRYYQYYLGTNDSESKHNMIINYVTGLYWTLRYYTGNNNHNMLCPDWEWMYYYRVAPTISDLAEFFHTHQHDGLIKTITDMTSKEPVTPDVQLLLILPPQSSELLNPKLQKLMFNVDSPIIFQYPTDFQIDMMDHRFRWECYPILPNVDLHLTKLTVKVLLDPATWHTKAKESVIETPEIKELTEITEIAEIVTHKPKPKIHIHLKAKNIK
jgi:5'-3' exonuclease